MSDIDNQNEVDKVCIDAANHLWEAPELEEAHRLLFKGCSFLAVSAHVSTRFDAHRKFLEASIDVDFKPVRRPVMAKSPSEKPSGSSRVVVGVRLNEAEVKWVDARVVEREKAGAAAHEAAPTNVIREFIQQQMTLYGLPPTYAAVVQDRLKEQGITLPVLISQLLTDYAVENKPVEKKDSKK